MGQIPASVTSGMHTVLAVAFDRQNKSHDLFARFITGGATTVTPAVPTTVPAVTLPAPSTDVPAATVATVPITTTTTTAVPNGADCVVAAGTQQQDLVGDPQPIPPHTPGQRKKVEWDISQLAPQYVQDVKNGAAEWSKSPCIDGSVVTSCDSDVYCVPVQDVSTNPEGDMSQTSGGATMAPAASTAVNQTDGTALHIQIYDDIMGLMPSWTMGTAITHEMGHSIGLQHRQTTSDLMSPVEDPNNPLNPSPDPIDFSNLLAIYGQ
jgi:hypothetical protein